MINKKDAKCWAELKSTEAGLDGSVYQRSFKDGFVSGIEYCQNISIKDRYEAVCLEYIKLFCEKQEVDFDGWVGDEIGGVASFVFVGEYYFHLSDIILDIDTNQPKGLILNWQNEGVDFNKLTKDTKHINYKSYTMGLRLNQI